MNLDDVGVDAARVASVVNFTGEVFHSVGGWNTLGPASAFALICLCVWVFKRDTITAWGKNNLYWRWRERRRMNSIERKRVNELVADIITDGLENAVHKEELTRAQSLKIYDDLSPRYPDLKRRSLDLKEQITLRLAASKRDEVGKVKVIPFPKEDAKPAVKKKTATLSHVHML